MKFIVELGIVGQVIHENGLKPLVGHLFLRHPVASQYPIGICVDDEHGLPGRIEQDAVCGFRADSLNGQKSLPEKGWAFIKEKGKVLLVFIHNEFNQIFQQIGFSSFIRLHAGMNLD